MADEKMKDEVTPTLHDVTNNENIPSLQNVIDEKNNVIAQLQHELGVKKEQEKKLWEWIDEMESSMKRSTEGTVSKDSYDEMAGKLEYVKEENNELEKRLFELKKENESLIEKINSTSEVGKCERSEIIPSSNDTLIMEYENELEETKSQLLEVKRSLEDVIRERDELRDLTESLNNKIGFLESKVAELENENCTLHKKIFDADEYVSKQENEKQKSLEKCQLEKQGNNLFTELIEGGKKVESDLKLTYEKLREEKKLSQSLRSKLSLLQNELDKKQEELIRFSKKKEIVYTEANSQKLIALEEHVKELEKQLADQIKVTDKLISNDDKDDTLKYKVENQKLRTELNKKMERCNYKIRHLSEELDQSKVCIEKLRTAVVDLRSITHKSESYRNINVENKLYEIEVNYDIRLSTSPDENSKNIKRRLVNANEIKEKVKTFRIDSTQ